MQSFKSHEVLREAIDRVGVKTVAYQLKLSSAMVYKWCQDRDEDPDGGTRNPLDRVMEIVKLTHDHRVINWLCHQSGGFFVSNPAESTDAELDLLRAAQTMVKHFSEVLDIVTRSIDNDGYITEPETKSIRTEWEELKTRVEHFVVACERGCFLPPGIKAKPAKRAEAR